MAPTSMQCAGPVTKASWLLGTTLGKSISSHIPVRSSGYEAIQEEESILKV